MESNSEDFGPTLSSFSILGCDPGCNSPNVNLCRKLRALKATLKSWSKNLRHKSVQESALLTGHFEELDLKAENGILSDPSKEFKLSKGLRQGDPMSPFLFIIAMKAFHIAMMEAREKRVFKGVEVGKNKVEISHLQYVDDALLVGVKNGVVKKSNKAPISVINLLEQIRRKFFWHGGVEEKKVSWVAWNKVIALVKSGDKDALWYHTLHSIHGPNGGDFLNYTFIVTKGTWYDILKAFHDVNSHNIPLSSFFTRSIESMKDCNISDRLFKSSEHLSSTWNWHRPIRNGREKEEMESLACYFTEWSSSQVV
ncbi:hypothetical protein Tco_0019083 [Tanacetum coccineum]